MISEEQRIAMGYRPRTVRGWWFWARFWSPPAIGWLKLRRGEMNVLTSAYGLMVLIALGLTLVHALTSPSRVPLWIPVLFVIVAEALLIAR